jgi:hypothetical protein
MEEPIGEVFASGTEVAAKAAFSQQNQQLDLAGAALRHVPSHLQPDLRDAPPEFRAQTIRAVRTRRL